jgi:acyl-CoA dehydrogenase
VETADEREERRQLIVESVRSICDRFPDDYWQRCDDAEAYPTEFVDALASAGWLGLLVPTEYGGGGGTVSDAAAVLEVINHSGGSGTAAHAQMYTMGTILRHGSEEQKQRWLPGIAAGTTRLQAFGVTEADAGSDTTRISTFARRDGDRYVINGSKMWTSRVLQSDMMLLIVRTTPLDEVVRRTDGLSVLVVDLRETKGIEVQPIPTIINHATNAVYFTDAEVPAENLIGTEGEGFRYILSGMNVERILVASEAIGDGRWFVDRSVAYGNSREVFGRPITANQGIQFPLARVHARLAAASLMRWRAAEMFDAGLEPAFEANSAKLLAAEASWEAANAAMDTFGGYGFAKEYFVGRKFTEARLNTVAPVSTNMILSYIATKVLGMPRSY